MLKDESRDCASWEEIGEFFEEHNPALQFITVSNYIDFQDIENPLQQQLTTVFPSKIQMQSRQQVEMTIKLDQNELETMDDPFDILGNPEKASFSKNFLTVTGVTKDVIANPESVLPSIDIKLELSSSKNLFERQAESWLDLLGDVGGFNDAVTIFFVFVMAKYTETMFEGRLVKGTKVEEIQKKHRKNTGAGHLRGMQEKLKANFNVQLNRLELKDLILQFRHIRQLKVPVFAYLCCLCCLKKSSKRKLQSKVLDKFEKHLDIRSITKQQTDLKILIDCLLSQPQKKLFRH